MRNSWLDTYTGGEKEKLESLPTATPRRLNIAVGILAAGALSVLLAGSMWMQLKDSQNAESHITASRSRSLKERAAAMLMIDKNMPLEEKNTGKDSALLKEQQEEDIFILQGISDLEATSEGSKLDPFAPLVSSGSGEAFEDPTKPKDILDDVQFTGFINDSNAKDKVAVIRIGNPAGGAITVVKKIGESFFIEDKKLMVKDIKSRTLYLSVGGVNRTLALTPYVDTVLAKGGGSGGSAPPSSGGPSGSGTTNSSGSLELEEI